MLVTPDVSELCVFLTVEVQLLAVWRQALPPCCARLPGEGAVQEQGRKETWQWSERHICVSDVVECRL